MKKILLFTLMTFLVQTTFCQNLSDTVNVEYSKNSPNRLSMSVGPLTSALAWHSLPNLNQFLKTQRIPTDNINDVVTYFPVGFSYQTKRILLRWGINLGITMADRDRTNNYSTSLNTINSSLSTGYAVFADRNNFLYLNLGIGFGEHTKTINKFDLQSTSLASALQNGVNQTMTLRNKQGFIDIGLELLKRSQGRRVGQSLRLGYRHSLKETPWDSPFIRLTGVPSDRINSIYLEGFFNIPHISRKNRSNPTNN